MTANDILTGTFGDTPNIRLLAKLLEEPFVEFEPTNEEEKQYYELFRDALIVVEKDGKYSLSTNSPTVESLMQIWDKQEKLNLASELMGPYQMALLPGVVDAMLFAYKKHDGQSRDEGGAYIVHPVKVANMLYEKGYGEDYIITGLLHDVIEDTDATYDEIVERFGTRVADAVFSVTKVKVNGKVNHNSYYKKVRANEIGRIVKLADRLDNLYGMSTWAVGKQMFYLKKTQQYIRPLADDTDFEHDYDRIISELRKSLDL